MGLSLSEYEEFTPKELNLLAEVYAEKEKEKVESNITFAWLNAYYQRVEKLSPLKECLDEALGRTPKGEEMSDDAMLEMVKRLNAQFGGKVEEGKETEQ